MEKLKVFEILEKNRDYFFPNEKYTDVEIEEALLNAPDSFEARLYGLKLYNPSLTETLARLTIGGDRLYLGDYKGGLIKILTLGGLGRVYSKEKKNAKERCRAINCENLLKAISEL